MTYQKSIPTLSLTLLHEELILLVKFKQFIYRFTYSSLSLKSITLNFFETKD